MIRALTLDLGCCLKHKPFTTRNSTWEIINVITWNQRNKSNIKLIGTWILQTMKPCQKDYHHRNDECLRVHTNSLLVEFNLSTRFEVLQWNLLPNSCSLALFHPPSLSIWAIKCCVMWQNVYAPCQMVIQFQLAPNHEWCFVIQFMASVLKFYEAFLCCLCTSRKSIHSVSTICAHYFIRVKKR